VTVARHEPVLLDAVCRALQPALGASGAGSERRGTFLDVTAGGGGHAAAVWERCGPARAVLLDRDPEAVARVTERFRTERAVVVRHARMSQFAEALDALGLGGAEAVLADLGVSSFQLDTAARGFSFREDGPLDLRMDPTSGEPAAEWLARCDAQALAQVLRAYGEEPEARRLAPAILAARPTRTAQLAAVVEAAMSAPARRRLGRRIHPATRTFQALRIAVNRELEELEALLEEAPGRLVAGGRLAVITFHSLEDRRVKRRFAQLSSAPDVPRGLPVREAERAAANFVVPVEFRGGVVAGETEVTRNPRARSARLRVIARAA
jgi:16S rRNA (cytosine1402-N4)-methyltransferase